MDRRRLAAIALAVCLALSGCSLLGGPSPTPTTPGDGTTTATTTTTTTATTTVDGQRPLPEPDRPPGVNATVLVDPGRLLDAHADRLVASGFAHEIGLQGRRLVETDAGERVVPIDRRGVVFVEADAAEYQRITTNDAVRTRVSAWGNRSLEAVRLSAAGTVRYQTRQAATGRRLAGVDFLRSYLRAGRFVVTGINRSGSQPLVTLTATELTTNVTRSGSPAAAMFPAGARNVTAYRAELVVDPDGRIHALSVGADYTIGGETARLEVRYELTATGGVSVGRPDWFEDYLAAGNTTT